MSIGGLFLIASIWHAIYISVVEIDVDQQTIAVKVFQDDFQDALRNRDEERFNGSVMENNLQLADEYFKEKLILRDLRKQPIDFTLHKIEAVGDVYWLHFTYIQPLNGNVEVQATILLELFPTQQNIIAVKKDGDRSFARLTQEKSTEKFDF
jgi:hypothetical protein